MITDLYPSEMTGTGHVTVSVREHPEVDEWSPRGTVHQSESQTEKRG